MRGDDIVEPAPHLLHAAIDDRLVVLDRATAVCHVLNASAGLILDAADGTRSVDGIVELLSEETGVDRDAIAPDVHDALDTFRAGGLVLGAGDEAPEPPPVPVSAQLAIDEPHAARRARWAPTVSARLDAVEEPTIVGPVALAGTTIELRTGSTAMAAKLEELTASLPRADDAASTIWLLDRGNDGPHRWRIVIDGELFASVAGGDDAVDTLAAKLNLIAVAGSLGRVLLHAGAVERDGQAIVVAGESGRGKSTLTAALVQAGFNYLTDELVLIDPHTARVELYPKALDLSAESHTLLGLGDPAGSGFKGRVSPSASRIILGGRRAEPDRAARRSGRADRRRGPLPRSGGCPGRTAAEHLRRDVHPPRCPRHARPPLHHHAGDQSRPHAARRRCRRREPSPPRSIADELRAGFRPSGPHLRRG